MLKKNVVKLEVDRHPLERNMNHIKLEDDDDNRK